MGQLLVFSLIGVVLIARPEFLFGHQANYTPEASAGVIDGAGAGPLGPSERGTASQRLGAVGYVVRYFSITTAEVVIDDAG